MILARADMAPASAGHIRSIAGRIDTHSSPPGNKRGRAQVCPAVTRVREGEMFSRISRSIRSIISMADTAGQLVSTLVMAACAIWRHTPGRRLTVAGGTGTDSIPGGISHMAEETIEADSSRPPHTWMTQTTGQTNSSCIITGRIIVGYK